MKSKTTWLRVFGLLLLGALLWRSDLSAINRTLREAGWQLVLAAIVLNIPLIFTKTVRWWYILRAQKIRYPLKRSFLAYFSSLYVGILTPGRLGEFVKALYVSSDQNISISQAFLSVLVDRLFDLLVLTMVGGGAILSLATLAFWQIRLGVGLLIGGILLVLGLLLTAPGGRIVQKFISFIEQKLLKRMAGSGRLAKIEWGLVQLSWLNTLTVVSLTILSYLIFFWQCYLLAVSLGLPLSFIVVSCAVAIGSLITLLPISISGLGTREAAIVIYLGAFGIPAEAALSFSILIFFTFYLGGGLMGAMAWWFRPIPLDRIRSLSSSQ